MSDTKLPRIMVVDDEEAILETMTFTFMDVYEVLTSPDARAALDLLDENVPVSVVIADQRMPNMSGVEFLAEVFERYPLTVRIMLTGFADADSTIQAINAGHVWAYISKPWDPDQLKTVVRSAVEHHQLALDNHRLAEDMRRANFFLEAVMDRLDTGAIAVDAAGVVGAANRPARQYLGLTDSPRGVPLEKLLSLQALEPLRAALSRLELTERDRGVHGPCIVKGHSARAIQLAPGCCHRAWGIRLAIIRHRPIERDHVGRQRDRLVRARIDRRRFILG